MSLLRFEPHRFEFRPVVDTDMAKLYEWIFRPHVRCWWDDPYGGIEDICAEFLGGEPDMLRTIGLLDGREIGYFQAWWDVAPFGEVGIDQFLASQADLGKGLGSAAVRAFANMLFGRLGWVERITLDPDPRNARAIRAYEKAGFCHSIPRSTDDIYLMTMERPA